MSRKYLGLDIQHTALAAVLIDSGLKGNWIRAHSYIPFPDGTDETQGLEAALEALVAQLDVASCSCMVSFPADQIFFRNMSVPFKQSKKIKQVLPFELEPTMPVPIDQLVIDFHRIDSGVEEPNTRLIAATVDTARMQALLDLLSGWGIDPEIVTAGGYPAALFLSRMGNIPGNSVLVDLKGDKGTLFVLSSGQLHLVRTVPSGSLEANRIEMLCRNIRRTLIAHENQLDTPGGWPEKVFLSGPGLSENGTEIDFARHLQIPVQQADLLNDVDIRLNNRPSEAWQPARMNNALALALTEAVGIKTLNFRKGPFAVTKRWAEHSKRIVRSAILLAALLVLVFTNVLIDYFVQKSRLSALNTEIREIFYNTFPDVRTDLDTHILPQEMRVRIDEARRAGMLPAGGDGRPLMIDMLNEISNRIPGSIDVAFTRMAIGDDNVVIAGNTDTFNSVDSMKNRLEGAEMFESVSIVSSNKDKTGNRIQFRMRLKF
jgi:type II secretion system protein L